MPDVRAAIVAEEIVLKPASTAFSEIVTVGSIVGLAGLDGHGQELFLECLAGLKRPSSGAVKTGGARPTAIGSLKAAAKAGVVYLPRDRRTVGIFANLSILDNFGIASLAVDMKAGWLRFGHRRRRYEVFRERLSIVAGNPLLPITTLSGGNQQKVLLARLLARSPDVLLLNDPTRGVDVATRRTLYRVFRDLAAQGMALVLLCSEIEEVIEVCDRVLVFREQSVSARLSGAEKTSERVIAAMFGDTA
jgi:ribose transport system ATP-binding protein